MSRHINKSELINKVRQLSGLTNEEKSALLELLNEKKTYGLVWENHEEAVEEQLREQLPVLREVPERRLLSNDAEAPNHIIIEAENLHVLVALTYTHAGKIDVMYLDPPYNTGNKDFVYNDSYIDSEDGYRHSKWLSFMEKRLKIAKTLLSDRGVIFISIDDNEQANLKILCDEIFGQDKYVASLIWQKKTGAADAKGIAVITEYALVYCNNIAEINSIFAKNKEAFDIKRYRYKDDYFDIRGPFYYDSLDRGSVRYSDSLNYGIATPEGTFVFPNDRTEFVNDGWTWKWSKEKVDWGIANGFIEIVKSPKKACGWSVKYKIYLNVDNEGNLIKKNVPYKNLIVDVLNADAANDIKDLFGNKAFNYAKPVKLIGRLLRFIESKDTIVLDFFAGSGTTLHATMQLNAEDDGHRQCILVTNNENGICENVTYERNKRVIQGYTTPKGQQVEGLKKNNLRYYKADFISRDPSSKNKRELVKASTDLLCIKENIYEETKIVCNGMTLRKDYARRFTDGNKEMLIIYEPAVIKYIVEEVNNWPTKEFIKIYVFSEGRYAFDDDFKGIIDKVTLCALPDAIYQAYRRVLPKRKNEPEIETDAAKEEIAEALADVDNYSFQDEEGGEA